MTRGDRLLIWSTTAAVSATGLLYAVFAYFMSPADPMDLDNHPWQAPTLRAHVLAAPLWMFAFGVVWHGHVSSKLRDGSRERRRTGVLLAALALVMAASGYLLQTAAADGWRRAWVVVHVGASVAWLGALVWHLAVRSGRIAPAVR